MRAALAIAVLALAAPAAAQDDPLAPVRFLAGACWLGQFEGGAMQDIVCYEDMRGGFMRSRHEVIGADYGGETIYYRDGESGAVRFAYYTSDGGTSSGHFDTEDGALVVPDQRYVGADGGVIWLHSAFEDVSSTTYRAVTRQWGENGWSEHFVISFVKLPPACRTIEDFRAGCGG